MGICVLFKSRITDKTRREEYDKMLANYPEILKENELINEELRNDELSNCRVEQCIEITELANGLGTSEKTN